MLWLSGLLLGALHAPHELLPLRHALLREPRAHPAVCSSSRAAVVDTPPVVVLGATGYIGKAVVSELVARGRPTIAFIRPGASVPVELEGATVVEGDVEQDRGGHLTEAIKGASGVISCISSRSGKKDEVWRVDYGASELALRLLAEHGADRAAYVLLSAICVKNPVLHLHRAKLAVEKCLAESDVPHVIVRPSAYFKSISAQVPNVVAGKPYVLFGDGTHTKCNAMGQRDLANLLVDSLDNAPTKGEIIEIGGPGVPITPRRQSQLIFQMAGLEPKYVFVPLALLDFIVNVFEFAERVAPSIASDLAESARIARFYATEDMIGPSNPTYGHERIEDFYSSAVSRAQESDEDLGLPASSVLASLVLSNSPLFIAGALVFGIFSLFDPLSSSPQQAATALLASSEMYQL